MMLACYITSNLSVFSRKMPSDNKENKDAQEKSEDNTEYDGASQPQVIELVPVLLYVQGLRYWHGAHPTLAGTETVPLKLVYLNFELNLRKSP